MSRLADAVRELDERVLDPSVRNAPAIHGLTAASLATMGLDLFDDRVMFPQMAVRWPDLLENVRIMQAWCESVGAWLAPHAKTTMAPHIFKAQLDAGAWGITVATVQQVRICRTFGIDRILVANEVRRPAEIAWLVAEMRAHPYLELIVIVDDPANVEAWISAARAAGLSRSVRLLVEMGMSGARTGVRDRQAVETLALAVERGRPWVALSGIEGYEGIASGATDADRLTTAETYLASLANAARAILGSVTADRPIVSAGGSVFFDRVAAHLGREALPEYQLILRPGGYVTHDSGFYERVSPLSVSNDRLTGHGHLTAALELWGAVLSRPEPSLAIAGFGHRDSPARIEMPVVNHIKRVGQAVERVEPSVSVRRMDDHHAYIDVANSFDPATEDIVGCGISHPCEAFERWRSMLAVDAQRRIIGAIPTFF